jgi:hypothetical protein
LAHARPGQTLQATALVHEAYLRLVGQVSDRYWDHRGHFFAAAAEAMRRIVVEKARQKQGVKNGGDGRRQELHDDLVIAVTDASKRLRHRAESPPPPHRSGRAGGNKSTNLRFFLTGRGMTLPPDFSADAANWQDEHHAAVAPSAAVTSIGGVASVVLIGWTATTGLWSDCGVPSRSGLAVKLRGRRRIDGRSSEKEPFVAPCSRQ